MGIVILGGLKGPWTVVPEGEGHGYLGGIQYDEEEDKVQCHACGKWFKQITTGHLRSNQCNGLVSDLYEYKIIYGFPQTMSLASKGTQLKHIKAAQRAIQGGTLVPGRQDAEKTKDILKRARQARKENDELRRQATKRMLGTESSITFHALNKHESCYPAQLGHALRKIAQMLGRTPKLTELPNELAEGLLHRYGTYDQACASLDIESRPYHKIKGGRSMSYTKPQLLRMLRVFKQQHGREPMSADTGRGQSLPSHATYRNHFDSFINAKMLADVIDK